MIKVNFLSCLFCATIALNTFAQSSKVDSLKNLLPVTHGDKRLDLLREIILEYWSADVKMALPYAEEAISSIPQAQDSFRVVRAYRNKGQVLVRLGLHNDALPSLTKGMLMAQRNNIKGEVIQICNLMGISYAFKGEYGKSLDYFFKQLLLNESKKDTMDSYSYNNIGLVYYKLKNNPKAIIYYEKALREAELDKDTIQTARVLTNIGLGYCELKDFKTALDYLSKGLLRAGPFNYRILTEVQFALGMTKYRMNDFYISETHLLRSLQIAREIDYNRFVPENLNYLARIYIETDRYDLARTVLRESEEISFNNNYSELLLDIYRVYIKYFERLSDVEELSAYYSRFIRLMEEIYGHRLLENLTVAQVEWAHHENMKTIARQRMISELQQEDLNYVRSIYYGVVVMVLLLIIIIGLLYLQVNQDRKTNKLLSARVKDREDRIQQKQTDIQFGFDQLNQKVRFVTSEMHCLLQSMNDSLVRDNKFFGKQKESIIESTTKMKKHVNAFVTCVGITSSQDFIKMDN